MTLCTWKKEKMLSYGAKELFVRMFAVRKHILRVLSYDSVRHMILIWSQTINLWRLSVSCVHHLKLVAFIFCRPSSITDIDQEPLHSSRRFLLICENRGTLLDPCILGSTDLAEITRANSSQMKTENREYSASVRHSFSFVATKIAHLLRWMPVNTLIPTGSRLWSVHIILFHSTLTFSLEEMLVDWTLWCTAAKSGPACSTLFSMCLLFHECTWAFEAAPRLKEPRLPACVCAFVRGGKWGRETVKQPELRTKLLWSRWSVANVFHLFVRPSEVPLQV